MMWIENDLLYEQNEDTHTEDIRSLNFFKMYSLLNTMVFDGSPCSVAKGYKKWICEEYF